MIIRPADLDKDALAIIDGAKDFAKFTGLDLFPTGDDFVKAVSRIITLEGFEILLAEHKDKIVGGIGILYVPYLWNPSVLLGDELFWWCKNAPIKTGKKLLDEAMKNIDKKGAIPMFRSLENSPKSVEKTYRNYGMFPIETVYTRI